eukprot:15317065-Heterocapsa_arctica.AAC.1
MVSANVMTEVEKIKEKLGDWAQGHREELRNGARLCQREVWACLGRHPRGEEFGEGPEQQEEER